MLNKKDQNGFAIVYGLVVLFLVTLGGMSLLYISEKDKESSIDYSKMRDAAMASKAAHSAFIGQCEENPNFVIALLDSFSSDSKYKWLFNSSISESVNEKRVSLWNGSDAPSFCARIMKYDTLEFAIQIEGRGFGGRGGQKKTTGIYKLEGIKREVPFPSHALFLGSGFGNCDRPLTINGDVFAGGNSHINSSSSDIVVNGNFKTGTDEFSSNKRIIVNGKSYFRGNVKFQGYNPVFNGKTGIQGNVDIDVAPQVNGDLYLNGTYAGNSSINVGAGPYVAKYVNGRFNPGKINVTAPAVKEAQGSDIDLASELQMADVDDEPPSLKSNLESYIQSKGGTVYNVSSLGLNFNTPGWNLNTAYSNSMYSKWNGFLVIKVTGNLNLNAFGNTFNGKAIWILDGVNFNAQKWYSSAPNSNTMIYLKNGARFNDFSFGDSKTFRGVIYNESSEQSQYKFGDNSEFRGSIIHTGSSRTQFQSGSSTAEIRYDKSVIDEYKDLGLLSAPSSFKEIVILEDIRIRPQLLGLSF